MLAVCTASFTAWTTPPPAAAVGHHAYARPRLGGHSCRVAMQQGPLEDGYSELLPLINKMEGRDADGNADAELVARMEAEVLQLTGVGLEGLLNPAKVVNLEYERLQKVSELEKCTDATERAALEERLAKIEGDLYREKRTKFRTWLKYLFIIQSVSAVVLSGFLVFDAFPTVTVDISLRALGFWSYWLFIIPSLRARRPQGWEKTALNYAFLGSPVLTLGLPFITKEPPIIWGANLVLLVSCYAYGYFVVRGSEDENAAKGFSGPLRWLDFGSGQERGMTMEKREAMQQKQAAEKEAGKELAKAASEK